MQLTAADLFSGCGGTSISAKKAGVKVVWAANHCKLAVLTHALNHPETEHVCQDLCQADWFKVPKHEILMASPACVGHTRARGTERKHHDTSRSTAWAVIDATEVCQPPFLLVENVPEFRNWRHYPRWKECLEEDYHLSENILDAADFSVPQHRVRLFILGVHKKISKKALTVASPHLPHCAATTIIDWETPNGWKKVYKLGRSENTLARVEKGREEFGRKPFLIAYYGASKGGRSLTRPLGTVTTHDRFALVDGSWMRMLNCNEYRAAMGFDPGYRLPSSHRDSLRMLGNAVVPACGTFLINQIKKFIPHTRLVA